MIRRRRRQQALVNIDARVELVGILVAWLAVARDVYDAALQIGQVVVVRVTEATKAVVLEVNASMSIKKNVQKSNYLMFDWSNKNFI